MNFTPDSRPVRQRKKTVMTDMIAPDDSTELVDLFTSMKSSNKVPESVHETPLPVRVKAVRQPKKRTRTRSSDLEIDNSSVVQIAKEPSPQKITINSANDKQYRILFTGINNVEKYAKMIEMLNGVQVEDWKECTHLVTNGIKRTVKFLCCVSTGKYIMDVKWLENSKKAGSFIDEEKFCLKDSANEKKFNFNLKSILEKSRLSSPIFNGLSFYSTKSAFPKLQDLQAIVEGAGGKLLSKAPSKLLESTYIVSSTADQQECEKLKRLGYQMYSIEMILTGILTQQLDLDKFILNLENDD
ncbi:BRCT domain-containing protein [Globomyces pollinis-pini]|nr:BRCT domain-containing protein [Globomyces pollinis-pini]